MQIFFQDFVFPSTVAASNLLSAFQRTRPVKQVSLHMSHFPDVPLTAAAQRAANSFRDDPSLGDLVFLEAWELGCVPGLGAMLRARQIRRSNPALATEIRAELIGLCRSAQGTPAITGFPPAHAEFPIHS